jgi:hypothetical protein
MELEASAQISLTAEEYRSGVDKITRHLKRDHSNRQIIPQSGVMPTTGPLLLDFGRPPHGALWVPLWLTVSGGDDHTAVANSSVATYLGGQPPNAATIGVAPPPLANLLIPATTATVIPYYVSISGKDAVYANQTDGVYCLVYGAAAGTNIVGVLRVREVHPACAEELCVL